MRPPSAIRKVAFLGDCLPRQGDVPNVVDSCGSLLHGRDVIIPYAMTESATSFANVPRDELLAAMK